ncbi:MAG TPA: polysaccharide deacetylase family protein [Solirubrobacterales bacterium]|nr:polysaccharide deacetylase family protein [Solirubrobacterales bacterium]
MTAWPGGARGALSLSFDNLGEAAELELGAEPGAPLGEHFTATRVLPRLLAALREHDVAATFFVEGLNTELYPRSLEAIAADGHEVAYHAWRHEQWGELSAAEQAENLDRGIAAFEALGLSVAGFRPPGGQLGAGGIEVLREAGLRYCSPEGRVVTAEHDVAVLPFQWRHVDAACVLPPMSAAREEMAGSPDPLDAGAFLAYLEAELAQLAADGGFATVILHPFMLDWLGEDRLGALLDLLGKARKEKRLWVAPCAEVAGHVPAA